MIAVMASEITIVIPANALDLYVLVTGYLYGTVVYSQLVGRFLQRNFLVSDINVKKNTKKTKQKKTKKNKKKAVYHCQKMIILRALKNLPT